MTLRRVLIGAGTLLALVVVIVLALLVGIVIGRGGQEEVAKKQPVEEKEEKETEANSDTKQKQSAPGKTKAPSQARNVSKGQKCPPLPADTRLSFIKASEAGVTLIKLESGGDGTVMGEMRDLGAPKESPPLPPAKPPDPWLVEERYDIRGTTRCGEIVLNMKKRTSNGSLSDMSGAWKGNIEGGSAGSLQLKPERTGAAGMALSPGSEERYEELATNMHEWIQS